MSGVSPSRDGCSESTTGQQGRWAAGVAELERALEHADAANDPATRRRVIGSLAASLCNGPTPVGEAINRLEDLLRSARSDRVLEAVLKRFLGKLYAMAARFDEALELVRQSGLVLDELNQLTVSWQFRVAAAYARALAGDRSGAEQELMARWLSFRDSGYQGVDRRAIDTSHDLARFYCDEGRWDDADRFFAYGRDVPLAAGSGTAVARLAIGGAARGPSWPAGGGADARDGCRRGPRSVGTPWTREPGSGSRSPRCSGRGAKRSRPVTPSRQRSASTSRKATSPQQPGYAPRPTTSRARPRRGPASRRRPSRSRRRRSNAAR